jgi:hypothetical protein
VAVAAYDNTYASKLVSAQTTIVGHRPGFKKRSFAAHAHREAVSGLGGGRRDNSLTSIDPFSKASLLAHTTLPNGVQPKGVEEMIL